MTRCYEYYCLFVCTPEKCDIESERGRRYVKEYIHFMQDKGVKFDKTPEDKAHFKDMVKEHGTEGDLTRRHNCAPPKIASEDYSVILADPPWKYDFPQSDHRSVDDKYPVMELEDIKRLQIPSSERAVLFLWATAPKLREALEVMAAWGFEYKTHAIWDKEAIGMGYWFRGMHELLLVGTRGEFSPPAENMRRPSIFRETRTEHSHKPHLVYDMIEEQFPTLKKVELFARHLRVGWEQWGNEIEEQVV